MDGSAVGSGTVGTSLDDLYRLHSGEALRVARSVTGNADDAADAVAEAFAGVLGAVSSGRLAGTEVLRPYLLAATRNAAIDIVRQSGRLRPTDPASMLDRAGDGVGAGGGPSDRLLAGEDRDLVARAFASLPPRWRAVLWLTEVEGMAPRDAALLLRLTPNNVAQLAVRARSRLRQEYAQIHVRNHARGDCVETAEHLGGLVAGALTSAQANRVTGHLAECAGCRGRLAELDDLGLSLRRAALAPLAVAGGAGRLGRLRWRWPWSRGGVGRAAWIGRSRGTGAGGAWLARVDPGAVGAVDAVGQLAGSPMVQRVAASAAAGLLALGVGTVVAREDSTPAGLGAPPAVEVAAPPTSVIGPGARVTLALPTTSTTTGPAAATADPAPVPGASAAPAAFSPRGPLAAPERSTVAQATVAQVGVYDSPGAATARQILANPRPSGAPLVFLVAGQQPGWVQVLLPVRPNGSSGWVHSDQVALTTNDFKIVVELGAHRITAYQGVDVLLSEPIGVGTAEAPTPGGLYFVTELFQPIDGPGGPYGPYAYGLSGHSDVLYDFGGGDGQFGIHGTNDPAGLGHDVSHGCIRMSNAGITRLAQILPLGVPVQILS